MEKQLRILLLEDLPTDAELVIDELQLSGLDFIHKIVDNEKAFIKQLEEFRPHIILSDYSLPTFNGMEALSIVTQSFAHIPVIMVTASINEETAVACMRAGAADYILKDKMKRLGMAVRTVLENHELKLQKRQAEQALQESGRYYRALLDQLNEHVIVLDRDFHITDVNTTFLKKHGYKRSEVIGKLCYEILHHAEKPGEEDGHNCALKKVFQTGRTETFLRRHVAKSGDQTWYNISMSPMMNSNGKVASVIESSLDVTDLMRAQEEIKKLSTAIEQSPVSVVLTDIEGNIEYVNPHFSKVSGYSRAEAIGQNPRILKSGDQSAELYKNLWETITAGNVWYGEFHNKRKDGVLFWEEATIGPVLNDQGVITHFLAVKEDVTEKKRLNQELSQVQKMEAVGRLAGGIAHDFNNLLTVINGYSEMALAKLSPTEPPAHFIKQIAQAGKKAAGLTQQLLAFSRKQVMQPRVLDPNQTIQDMGKLLKRLIGENINLQFDLANDLPTIEADPAQLDQVIINLAVNARDAMPDGGDLVISTNAALPGQTRAEFASSNNRNYVRISVSDSGVGMDEETKSKIFEPFFSTKEKGKGTGLGLATIHGIVNQNDWTIEVVSAPGKGSSFHIYIPKSKKQMTPPVHPAETSMLYGTETILFVEDETEVRTLVSGFLKQAGYTVLQAENGDKALDLVKNQKIKFDLLLSDVIMPKMGGKKLADKLKQQRPDLKVIYISGYTDETISRSGILDKEILFLQKPFEPKALLELIRKTLDAAPENQTPTS